jgi:1-acyl-sn-glycerol-3-phosphate acyltransferase
MINAGRYKPTNTRLFTWIVRNTYGSMLKCTYRAKAKGLELFDTLKPPFILIGNHTTLLDPFLANAFVPFPVHWVASDGNMRSPIMRFLLIKLVGSIPKSKAIPDIETVNWIVEFIRKRKGVVGFYPEGQSSWNGTTVPAFGSSAKLLKLLKAPVILVHSRGSYMTKPRWAYSRRKGQVELEFSQIFSPESLKALAVEEIDATLNAAIAHDDQAWAKAKGLMFQDSRRAECLELALYACPSCGALHTLHSLGSELRCSECATSFVYREDGGIVPIGEPGRGWKGVSPSCPGTVRDWDTWQEAHFERLLVSTYLPNPRRIIFQDAETRLFRGRRMDTMDLLGRGTIRLSAEGIIFAPSKGEEILFSLAEISGPGVLKWNFFEFYVGKTVYRAKFSNRADSGRKYAVGLSLLAKLTAL